MNFKKIASIAGSLLMAGMSMGFASAAAFPAPFVQNGVANAAIVYGTGVGVSSTDYTAAAGIQTALAKGVTPTGVKTISGEHVNLDRPSSLLELGTSVGDVFGRSITKAGLKTVLADGTYRDNSSSDHNYIQSIKIANRTLNYFNKESYGANQSTPTIGLNLTEGTPLLNYTLTFQDKPNSTSKMAYTNIDIMGKTYYILSTSGAGNTAKMTLLDSASSASLNQGDSKTIIAGGKTYTVKANYISSSDVKLTVNNQTTGSLAQGDTYKLSDGSYLAVQDVYSNGAPAGSYLAGTTVSIGSGKIVLNSGWGNVQVNDNTVNGLKSNISMINGDVSKIQLNWVAKEDSAITKDNSLTMPTFGGVKLSFSGMNYSNNEVTTVTNRGDKAVEISAPIETGTAKLDILSINQSDGNFSTIGKDSNNLLQTSSKNYLNFNAHGSNSSSMFVVSWNDTKDSESYVYKVGNFQNNTGGPTATLSGQYGASDVDITNDTSFNIGIGNIALTPIIDYSAKTVNFTEPTPGTTFDTLYTKDGLKIMLPTKDTTATGIYTTGTNTTTTYPIQFFEANKDGTLAGGAAFNVTVSGKAVGDKGTYKVGVNNVNFAGSKSYENGDTQVQVYNIPSDLATNIQEDQSPSQHTATITYHGGKDKASFGTLTLSSPSATVSNGASSLGSILYKDSEVSKITADNVIVVGGSCINSAAAQVLGVPSHTCGEAFTKATGVGAGQYLIEGFAKSKLNGKYAVVVAGYGPADTTNAASYLTMKNPDLAKKLVGTSATEATVVTQ